GLGAGGGGGGSAFLGGGICAVSSAFANRNLYARNAPAPTTTRMSNTISVGLMPDCGAGGATGIFSACFTGFASAFLGSSFFDSAFCADLDLPPPSLGDGGGVLSAALPADCSCLASTFSGFASASSSSGGTSTAVMTFDWRTASFTSPGLTDISDARSRDRS